MVTVTSGGLAQVGKFGIVGILNTILDFSIFNALTGKRFRLPKIQSNIASTSVAMIFSFVANRQAVFAGGSGNPVTQAALFFVTTGFGLYMLQTSVFYFLHHRWMWPAALVGWFLQITGLQKRFSVDFVLKNGVKASATVMSLIWNFFMYKYVVFR